MFPGLDEAELSLPGWQRSSEAFLADRSVGGQVEGEGEGEGQCKGRDVGPGTGNLVQRSGLVIVSNNPL